MKQKHFAKTVKQQQEMVGSPDMKEKDTSRHQGVTGRRMGLWERYEWHPWDANGRKVWERQVTAKRT